MTIVHVNGATAWVPLDFALDRAAARRERMIAAANHAVAEGRNGTSEPIGHENDSSTAMLTAAWSPPDVEGWCYAIDSEGRERARHVSLLPTLPRLTDWKGNPTESREDHATRIEQHRRLRDPTLQRLDETDAEWEERLAAMHRSAELVEALAGEKAGAKAKV